MIREVMLDEGYKVKGVIAAEGFISGVRRYKPDLVLVDYNLLSKFTGLELCRQIKANPKTAHIPVIMMTAYPWLSDCLKYWDPDAVIFKPFSVDELTRKVKNLLFFDQERHENMESL